MAPSFMDQYIIDTSAKLTDIDSADIGMILDLYAELIGNAADPSMDVVRRYPQACLIGLLQGRIKSLLDIIERQREDMAHQASQIMDLADNLADVRSKVSGQPRYIP